MGSGATCLAKTHRSSMGPLEAELDLRLSPRALVLGSTIRAWVFVDEVERPDGAAWLRDLPPEAVHAVEVYDNGRQIRIYTNRFMNQLARNPGLLMPIVIVW